VSAKEQSATLSALRTMMLLLLLLGLIGTAVELWLLAHSEDWLQWIPMILIGAGLLVASWHMISGAKASLRVMRVIMAGFVLSGAIGIWLHYRGGVEFQQEVDPSIAGFELFMKVMESKAPPMLAPGVMAQLGLLGLAYTYRHPALLQGE
jgi:hypothetical protein